jgi:alanine racemase
MGTIHRAPSPRPIANPEERIIVGTAAGLRREARIDLDALADNLRSLTAQHGAIALDVRADAHGHSLELVLPIARQAGVAGFLTSGGSELPSSDGLPLISSAAYGVDPNSDTRPVMTLVGEIVSVKHAAPGSGVSYGYSYRTSEDTTLSLVALGYADGIPRLASNRASAWLGGGRYPVVGRVAMDQFVVESGAAHVAVGGEVVVFGDPAAAHPTAWEWGEQSGRSALQLTAGLGARVQRVAVRHG